MAQQKVIEYEARISMSAIAADTTVGVQIPEDSRKHWPLNEWELENYAGEQVSVLENQNTERAHGVKSLEAVQSDQASFTSLSIRNDNVSNATSDDEVVVFVRKYRNEVQ